MNLSPLRSTLSRLSSPLNRQTTVADQAIMPYARRAAQEDRAKQKQFQPLKMVLDLLQRGQYLTANIADEVEESFRTGRPLGESTIEVLKAAFQGITGERKGDWETLLFGGNIEGTSDQAGERPGWLPESMKGPEMTDPLIHWGGDKTTGLAEGILRPRKIIGTVANIALDPTTYIGFGATKAAKATASKFAQDTLKLTVATMGPDDFAKLGIKFSEKVGKNVDDVVKVMAKSSIGKRFMEDTYNKAFQTALRMPGKELIKDISPKVEVALDRSMGNQGLSELLSKMDFGYGKAGERAFRLGGKEVGAGVRQPWLPSRAWDTIKTKFATTKPGAKLGDAWWSIMNNGPIGGIKRALGIRNPYEQLVHLTKRRVSDIGIHTMGQQEGAKFNQLFKGLDEETKDKAIRIMASAEGGTLPVSERLLDPAFQQLNEVLPDEVDKFRGLFDKLKQTSDEWFAKEKAAAELAGVPFDTEAKIVYYPQKQGTGEMAGSQLGRGGAQGTGSTGFTKHKNMTVDQKIRNNAALFDYLMGDKLKAAFENSKFTNFTNYQEFLEDWVVRKNLTESAIDLQTAFTIRGMDHANAMAKYNMIDEFRQFGIPIQDAIAAEPRLADSLMTWGEGTSKLGLYKVNVPGFQDYIFDEEVAKTLTNVGTMLSGGAPTQELVKAFGWMTQWWKGFVLMTPGYHIRNFLSNNVTGFIKFGPRWLNSQKYFGPTSVGAMYALHPENYMDLITKQLNVKPGWVEKQLNTRIGDFTVRELADYTRQTGLMSARTQAAGEIGQKVAGRGTLEKISAKHFKPFQVSQKVGDFIENSSKFQSFIMDYEDMVGKGGGAVGDLAERLATQKQYLEYADQEAKKWFIDYSDLTDWEKKTLAKVIPFYCVPDYSEILTRSGWKKYDSLRMGEEVLTYNIDGNYCEWQPVKGVSVFDFDGNLVRLKNHTYADFVSTDDHRWPVEVIRNFVKGRWYGGNRKIVKTIELNTTHNLIMAAPLKESKSILSVRDATILGWVVTDGYFRWRKNHLETMIYQAPHKYASELRALLGDELTSESIHPETGVICFRIKATFGHRIKSVFKSKDDLIKIVCNLSSDAALAMRDAMLKAEGVFAEDGSTSFAQLPGPVLDSFQILCQMAGSPFYTNENKSPCRCGYSRKSPISKFKELTVSPYPYKGKIWCPQTPNSTWVMKQGKSIICTGNSWLRHNIANQLSGLALYPEMYSIIPKVREAITNDEDFDYSIMPDYMKNQGYYPIGKTQAGTDIMRWANIPLEDLNKIPIMFEEGNIFRWKFNWTEIKDDIMSAAHPLLKTAVEMATGYDVFHKREIRPLERAAPVFQYLNNAPNVVKFLDGAMRLAGFEDGIKINVSRDGKEVQINGKVERFLETNVPALRTLDLLLGGTEVALEGMDQRIEQWVETTFGKKDYYKGLEELFQITSPLGGVKFKEFNQEEQRKIKEAQLYAEAQRLKARDAVPTRAKETRAAKARLTRETRNRRLFR